jgi:hypothetical protein
MTNCLDDLGVPHVRNSAGISHYFSLSLQVWNYMYTVLISPVCRGSSCHLVVIFPTFFWGVLASHIFGGPKSVNALEKGRLTDGWVKNRTGDSPFFGDMVADDED